MPNIVHDKSQRHSQGARLARLKGSAHPEHLSIGGWANHQHFDPTGLQRPMAHLIMEEKMGVRRLPLRDRISIRYGSDDRNWCGQSPVDECVVAISGYLLL